MYVCMYVSGSCRLEAQGPAKTAHAALEHATATHRVGCGAAREQGVFHPAPLEQAPKWCCKHYMYIVGATFISHTSSAWLRVGNIQVRQHGVSHTLAKKPDLSSDHVIRAAVFQGIPHQSSSF